VHRACLRSAVHGFRNPRGRTPSVAPRPLICLKSSLVPSRLSYGCVLKRRAVGELVVRGWAFETNHPGRVVVAKGLEGDVWQIQHVVHQILAPPLKHEVHHHYQ
jgi:hypothetical protein